jgi:hypothetical protein
VLVRSHAPICHQPVNTKRPPRGGLSEVRSDVFRIKRLRE